MIRRWVAISGVILLAFLATLPLVGAQTAPEITPLPTRSLLLVQDAFVRSGPNESYIAVGQLLPGAPLFPLNVSEDGNWVLIRYNRGFGWIRRDLALWSTNIDNLPPLAANLTPTFVPGPDTATPFFPTNTPSGDFVQVNATSAYLRGGPAVTYLRLGQLYPGATLEPVGRNADASWVLLRVEEGFAWLRADLGFWMTDLNILPVLSENRLTPSATFTASNTSTATPTPTDTASATSTFTATSTPSNTDTATATITPSHTMTASATPTDTETATLAPTETPTATQTPSPEPSPTDTATSESTVVPSDTATDAPSETHTATAEPTLTNTDTLPSTQTPSPEPIPTDTATSESTVVPSDTATDAPSETHTATAEPTAINTDTPTATNTEVPTSTNTNLPTATHTDIPTATDTASPTATNTNVPTSTNTDVPTATQTDLPTATNTETATVTNTATDDETRESSQALTNAPAATHTPTDEPTTAPSSTPTPEPTATATIMPEPSATNTAVPTETDTSTGPQATATLAPLPTDTKAPENTQIATETPDVTSVSAIITVTSPPPTDIPALSQTPAPVAPDAGASSLSPELLAAGALLLLILGYVGLFLRGAATASQYTNGFIIDTCPVCGEGNLTVESRTERNLGIPNTKHVVRCDRCRSVLRESGGGRWRYAVDRAANPALYDRLNNREIREDTLKRLLDTPAETGAVRTSPEIVDDDPQT